MSKSSVQYHFCCNVGIKSMCSYTEFWSSSVASLGSGALQHDHHYNLPFLFPLIIFSSSFQVKLRKLLFSENFGTALFVALFMLGLFIFLICFNFWTPMHFPCLGAVLPQFVSAEAQVTGCGSELLLKQLMLEQRTVLTDTMTLNWYWIAGGGNMKDDFYVRKSPGETEWFIMSRLEKFFTKNDAAEVLITRYHMSLFLC